MRFFTKKSKAIKNWHSRAMIIDLSKTKVIMINTADLDKNVPAWKRGKSGDDKRRLKCRTEFE